MITRRVKLQLLIFAIITLVGTSFVGARYAHLDRLVVSRTYDVKAEFKDSGGIFTGAEVTYRGVGVGRVTDLEFTDKGVQATLSIDKSAPNVPAATRAIVANKSAVGEQYVDLQPKAKTAPYLKNGSRIALADTDIPLDTSTLLVDVNNLVESVDTRSLKTVVDELGTAFEGTGTDLSKIIDTSNSFIETADDNFGITASLIKNSSTVLQTQVDKASDLQSFSKNLSLLSDTLVGSDTDLRTVIDNGAPTAGTLRKVIAENADDLGTLLNDVRTTNKILVANIDGLRGLLILYPYAVEGGFSVLEKDENGHYMAHFGLVPSGSPDTCKPGDGYREARLPNDLADLRLNKKIDCTLPASKGTPRAARHAYYQRAGVVGVYDGKTQKVTPPAAQESDLVIPDSQALGKDSWKWLLLGPTAAK